MFLILLEALVALLLLILIVWWTMFSGRRGGELPEQEARDAPGLPPPDSSRSAGKPPH